MYDGSGFAILLGVVLASFVLLAFLVVRVLLHEARTSKLLDALRTDDRLMYLICVKLLARSDWEVRCPACDADLLSVPLDEEAEDPQESDFEDTE